MSFSSPDAEAPQSPPSTELVAQSAEPALEWAPANTTPKKKRVGLWIGLGVGALVIGGAVAASTILIAPGTTIAGVNVGWLTEGAATDALNHHVAQTEIVLTGAGSGNTVTASDLGARVDASALVATAFAERPLWNVTAWMGKPIAGKAALDKEVATETMQRVAAGAYTDAVDATVVFDSDAVAYVTTPAKSGTAADLDAISSALDNAFAQGDKNIEFRVDPVDALPAISDKAAGETAADLNALAASAGFYVGEERTVPIDPFVLNSWITITNVDGALKVVADKDLIQVTVDALPAAVNRVPVSAQNIVDTSGSVLQELVAGVTGRELVADTGMADTIVSQLEDGNPVVALTVNETAFTSVALERRIEVNLSNQMTYLFENGNVVNSWRISSGKNGFETDQGRFRVRAHVRIQDMKGDDYVTKDVPWVTYFNGDEAFHGTYWHNNYGTPMSHGCVNMTFGAAESLYNWAPLGTEVWVHS